jgi:hypothetical protein
MSGRRPQIIKSSLLISALLDAPPEDQVSLRHSSSEKWSWKYSKACISGVFRNASSIHGSRSSSTAFTTEVRSIFMESWKPSRPVPRLPPQSSLFSALPQSMRNPERPSVQMTSSIISYHQHPVCTSWRCEQLYPERDRSAQLIRNIASKTGRGGGQLLGSLLWSGDLYLLAKPWQCFAAVLVSLFKPQASLIRTTTYQLK